MCAGFLRMARRIAGLAHRADHRSRSGAGRCDVLRAEDPAGAGEGVLRLPLGRGQEAQGGSAARHPGGRARGGRLGAGRRSGQARREPAARGAAARRDRDAPQGQAARRGGRRLRALDHGWALPTRGRASGRRRPGAASTSTPARRFWAYQPPRRHAPPAVADAAWPRTDIDRFILAALEARGLRPGARRRPGHARPPALLRPDRPAADARGDRRVRRRPVAGRLRAAGRPAAGLAPLRRALGPALARRRPLRRVADAPRVRPRARPGATATT